MSHSGHGTIAGSRGLGVETNYALAKDFWYIIAGAVGFGGLLRAVNYLDARRRLASCPKSLQHATRPAGPFTQAWATATAFVRELSHPQLYIPIRGLRWASPPPLGRVLVLLAYFSVVLYMMCHDAIYDDVYFFERIGFRNAWITATQLPMVFLLSMKINPIGLIIGIGHERLNWLHRWAARIMFLTATVHGFHFWTQWVRSDLVEFSLTYTPLVKYGLGAWGILLWNVFVGLLPIRRLAYEVWVLHHVVSFAVMLWALWRHMPEDAQYNLWMAISFVVFDRVARWALLAWQNFRLSAKSAACQGKKHIGHRIAARVSGSTTILTIKDVHFKWSAGQHVYLYLPRVGPVEAHPYTIASSHDLPGTCCCNSVQLIVRAQGGFSKRLHRHATKHPDAELTGFLSGPFGAPPRWDIYETLVLIGASTGASFVVPLLESAAGSDGLHCARRIEVALMAKTAAELEYFVPRVRDAAGKAARKGIDVRLHVAITGQADAHIEVKSEGKEEKDSDSNGPLPSVEPLKACGCTCVSSSPAEETEPIPVQEYSSRVDIAQLIREPVEAAWGETAVVVCGGAEVVSQTRNVVSRLSDERAVHKGTGAQGIYLHVEEYSF